MPAWLALMDVAGEKFRVWIATTAGPVAVLLLTAEDPPIGRSVVCVGGTTETADIDTAYHAFVARPTGVIERMFGHPCYRLDVSGRIDSGSSWQLGVLTAHALHAENRLAQEGEETGSAIWATGTVRSVDLTVGAVGHLREKVAASRESLVQQAKVGRVLMAVPASNAGEIDPDLRRSLLAHGIEIVELAAFRELAARLTLDPPPSKQAGAALPRALGGEPGRPVRSAPWHTIAGGAPMHARAPTRPSGVPFMAPDPPTGFVERPQEMALLKAKLLDCRGGAVALTAALRGAGGFGKSALASRLCHDPDVQRAFVDGILHVELGEKPDNLGTRIADLVEVLTGERSGLQTLGALSAKLAEALGERRYLLVIDDVWRSADLRPFLQGGPNTTRLITTRLDHVLPPDAYRVAVDAMQGGEAVALLAQGIPAREWQPERPALQRLAARLGEWPLLLTLVNAFLRNRSTRDGRALADAIVDVDRRLDVRGLTAFDAKDDSQRHLAVARTIGVSLELLSEGEQTRFRELGVFPEDTDVPVGVCARLWRETGGLGEIDTEDLLQRLAGYSLLLALDSGLRTFRLHDVVRQYLIDTWRTRQNPDGVKTLHERLIFAMGDPRGMHLEDDAERRYAYLYGASHLSAAGRTHELAALLLDPRWMLDKLGAVGPQSLISDYRSFGSGRAQDLIGRALDLSSRILARAPAQLPMQLCGRLAPGDADGLGAFLDAARDGLPCPAIVPQLATFAAPGSEIRRLEGYGTPLVLAALDGRRVLCGAKDGMVRLIDVELDVELRRYEGHTEAVSAVAVLDARRFVSASIDGTLRLWDIEMAEELRRFEGHDGGVWAVAVFDDRRIVSGSGDATVRLWDVETGEELRRLVGHGDCVNAVAAIGARYIVSGSGRSRVSDPKGGEHAASRDASLRLWDVETGREVRRFEGHGDAVNAVVVLDRRRIASASTDLTLRIWDVGSGEELRRFEGHFNWVVSLTALDAKRIVSGGGDHTVRIWDIETGRQLARLQGPSGWIYAVAAVDDRRLVAGSSDLRVWDLEKGEELHRPKRHEHWVGSIVVLDERRFATSSWDRSIRLWDIETGEELRRFEGHRDWVWTLDVLAGGQRIVSASADGTLRLWDVATGSELRCLEGHAGKAFSVAVLDDRHVVSASEDGTMRLWDIETGRELRRFEGHDGGVCALLALGGKRIVSGSIDKTLRLWDVETGRELRRFEGHGHTIWKLALLDQRHVVSGSFDGTLRLWDIETGRELRRFEGHNAVRSIAAVDARHLLSGGHDDTLRLWDIASGRELARLDGDAAVTALAALPDSRTVLAGDAIGGLHRLEVRLP
jgi:WD40 repeat protein